MKIVLFYHSLISDWNHGNAHFLRGIAAELISRGHDLHILEPRNAWSALNLTSEHGLKPVTEFRNAYPLLTSTRYDSATLDLDQVLDHADLVVVHEWNEPALVARIGRHRDRHSYTLLFHDTHHRMITDRQSMDQFDLQHYDGVLAYGAVLQHLYESSGRVRRAWTWHEAADTRVFKPLPHIESEGDLVWIGNWGDGERTHELSEYMIEPVRHLQLKARVYGVRYPEDAQQSLADAGIQYDGWLPNFHVPKVFARFRVTPHIPRGPYVQALPGIPTIRVFEALACGIPLVCSAWCDEEHLFQPGRDYLVAKNGRQMKQHLLSVIEDHDLAASLAASGLARIRERHTCSHRVDELLAIHQSLKTQP